MSTQRDYHRDWLEFWEDICTTDSGELDLDQIKRELSDYKFIAGQVALVYAHVTGGRYNRPTTCAQAVINGADEEMEERLNEALEAIQGAN